MDLEKSEYELMREKNILEQQALFESMFKDIEEFHKNIVKEDEENSLKESFQKKSVKKKSKKFKTSLRLGVDKPTEIRKSKRNEGKKPKYKFDDKEEIPETVIPFKRFKKINDLQAEFSFKKKPDFKLKVPSYSHIRSSRIPLEENDLLCNPIPIRRPNEITADEISKIADKVGNKVYSENGTYCHQCKLKSMDTKTCCRSGFCIGVRGQFCGPCLKNRYNQSVAIVLKDPNWNCPPCRQICNCSYCRNCNPNFLIVGSSNLPKKFKEILENGNLIGYDKDV